MRTGSICFALFLALGCAPEAWAQQAPDDNTLTGPLARFDTNHDGSVSLAEMDAVLRADFNSLDHNHDSALNGSEMAEENERRSQADASATLLFDWKGSGFIDFDEFAAPMHTLFAQLDRNKDGVLSQREADSAPSDGSGAAAPAQGQGRGGHRRH